MHCITIIVIIHYNEVNNPPVFLLEEIASRAPTPVNTFDAHRDTAVVADWKEESKSYTQHFLGKDPHPRRVSSPPLASSVFLYGQGRIYPIVLSL